jgi:hypothetical protein
MLTVVDKELVDELGLFYIDVSKGMVEEGIQKPSDLWMTGFLMGIALAQSHPDVAMALLERFQNEDVLLAELAVTDQTIEVLKRTVADRRLWK